MENQMQKMEKIGYRFVGNHSAIKICEWTREAIRGKDFCYKQKFYGIKSHRCIQLSPSVFSCTHNCLYCWRTLRFKKKIEGKIDKPEDILDNAIKEQKKILQGFWGAKCEKSKLREAEKPNQVAISLIGEPCLYPKLPEFINLIKERNMTAFLVSNGTVPEMIKKLIDNQPTNMYVTLPAPNEKVYKKTCNPLIKDGWQRIQKSLSLLKEFDRSVIRLTLAKNLNMVKPEEYAGLLEAASPTYVEAKAFMPIGGAQYRVPYESMPRHKEIKTFAEKIVRHSSYKIENEKEDSRVVLLKR